MPFARALAGETWKCRALSDARVLTRAIAAVIIRGVAIDSLAGGLFEAAVKVEAHATHQQVRHTDHQVNAVIVSAGFPQGVVIVLRTGGQEGVLSVGTAVDGAGRDEGDGKHCEK